MKFSSRTFGVEFELFFTEKSFSRLRKNNKKYNTEEKNYQSLDSYDGWHGYDDDYDSYEIVSNIMKKRLGLVGWEIDDDSSIEGPYDSVTMEIKTPILKGIKGLKQIQKFLSYFSKYASVNKTCGLHVHVGAFDFKKRNSLEMVTTALMYYSKLESTFDLLVDDSRRKNNNEYAIATSSLNQLIESYSSSNQTYEIQEERYHKLNIESLNEHGTLEFRQMHGTLDYALIKNWIIVCTSFVDMVAVQYKNLMKPLKMQVKNRKLNYKTMPKAVIKDIEKVMKRTTKRSGIPQGIPGYAINNLKKIQNKSKPLAPDLITVFPFSLSSAA